MDVINYMYQEANKNILKCPLIVKCSRLKAKWVNFMETLRDNEGDL